MGTVFCDQRAGVDCHARQDEKDFERGIGVGYEGTQDFQKIDDSGSINDKVGA